MPSRRRIIDDRLYAHFVTFSVCLGNNRHSLRSRASLKTRPAGKCPSLLHRAAFARRGAYTTCGSVDWPPVALRHLNEQSVSQQFRRVGQNGLDKYALASARIIQCKNAWQAGKRVAAHHRRRPISNEPHSRGDAPQQQWKTDHGGLCWRVDCVTGFGNGSDSRRRRPSRTGPRCPPYGRVAPSFFPQPVFHSIDGIRKKLGVALATRGLGVNSGHRTD